MCWWWWYRKKLCLKHVKLLPQKYIFLHYEKTCLIKPMMAPMQQHAELQWLLLLIFRKWSSFNLYQVLDKSPAEVFGSRILGVVGHLAPVAFNLLADYSCPSAIVRISFRSQIMWASGCRPPEQRSKLLQDRFCGTNLLLQINSMEPFYLIGAQIGIEL